MPNRLLRWGLMALMVGVSGGPVGVSAKTKAKSETGSKTELGSKFKRRDTKDTCVVVWEPGKQEAKKVVVVPECSGATANLLKMERELAGRKLPPKDGCGNELRVFSMPSNRRGRSELTDYWFVWANARSTWTTPLENVPTLEAVKFHQDDKYCSVALYVPPESDPGRTELSRRYELMPGKPSELVIELGRVPKRSRQDNVTVAGRYSRTGNRASGYQPTVVTNTGETYVVDAESPCRDQEIPEGAHVVARFEVRRIEGNTSRRVCTAISGVGGGNAVAASAPASAEAAGNGAGAGSGSSTASAGAASSSPRTSRARRRAAETH